MTTMANFGPTQLDARRYDQGPVRVLELFGECDLVTGEVLRAALADALSTRPKMLVLDLSRVEFCDAAGAGLVFSASQHTRVALARLAGVVRRLFDVHDPDQQLPRYATIGNATSTQILGQEAV
jgi:anti-sigma B factor antagonist